MKTCSVDGCDRAGKIRRGLCNVHYFRWYRHGSLEKRKPGVPERPKTCPGCGAEFRLDGRPQRKTCSDDCADRRVQRGAHRPEPPAHGTWSRYCIHACRCPECRELAYVYQRDRMAELYSKAKAYDEYVSMLEAQLEEAI